MSMGWEDVVPYTLELTRRRCACGKGYVVASMRVEEESDYPPFRRGTEETYSTCPDKCE